MSADAMAPGGEGAPRNSGAGPGPGSAGAPPGADAGAGAGAGWGVPGEPLGWRELGGLAGACAVRGPLGLEGALAPGGAWVSLLLGGLLTPLWQAPLAALTAELGTSPDLAGAGGSVEWVRRTQGPGVTAAVAVATVLGSCAWAAQAGLLLSETASLTLAGGYASTSATAVAIASEKGGEGRAGPCPSPAACAALFALVVVAALAPNLWAGGRGVARLCIAGTAALVAPYAVFFLKMLPQVAVFFSRRLARWPPRVKWASALRASAYLYAGHDRVAVFAADEVAAREKTLPRVLRLSFVVTNIFYAMLYIVALFAVEREGAWAFGSLPDNLRPAAGAWLASCFRAGGLLGALGAFTSALFVGSRLTHAAVSWDGGVAVPALAVPRWALMGVASGAIVGAALLGYERALRLDAACYMFATVFKFRALQIARAGSRPPPSFRQDRYRLPLDNRRVMLLTYCPILIASSVFFCCGWDVCAPVGALAGGAALYARRRDRGEISTPAGAITRGSQGVGVLGRWRRWGSGSQRYAALDDGEGEAPAEEEGSALFEMARSWGAKSSSRARSKDRGRGSARAGASIGGKFASLASESGSESE